MATDNFTYNGVPYGKGQLVDQDVYDANHEDPRNYVKEITGLTANSTTYYCYQKYTIGSGGSAVTTSEGTTLTKTEYDALINDQQYFDIQGKIPEETTTLYVNRESDIKDVTQEKVITVVYQYTYYEPDESGDIKLTNELHVVNVHLQMESGIPIIGPLEDPPLVLPGDAVGLKAPEVTPGAYEVMINGWELFDDKNDALNHHNGVPFTNNETPVYWYQNGDHYIAFYSKTYLGKTYSNPVPLAVANYHDIADIMERQKENHLYIDRSDVDRPCKIYINDYSTLDEEDLRKGKNGLDELKALYDLSVLTPPSLDSNGLINSGSFEGHAPLGSHIKGCGNLEIILRTDIDRTQPAEGAWTAWTPIGDATTCFGGNIHGDGHTISGLETSLFGSLCGDVYNLGVTGSFTGAGIAETGDGYVENCWISTSSTEAKTSKPIFDTPDMTDTSRPKRIINCYYQEEEGATNPYTNHSGNYGIPTPKSAQAFYNGEVAYDLNGFYLNKRYYDNDASWTDTKEPYNYIIANADGSLPTSGESTQATVTPANYPEDYAWYKPKSTTLKPNIGYVEHRFYDGDFRYANGTIPESYNIRRQENIVNVNDVNVTDITWVPIWPDDYLFFGQTLTYGHVDERPHQPQPTAINKIESRLPTATSSATTSNRVYRAPAYFRSKDMSSAYFNPNAVFAATSADKTKEAHINMTAIDFTGGEEAKAANGSYGGNGTYSKGTVVASGGLPERFYPPLLDDDGIFSFQAIGLTKNLLAYTKSDGQTATTVSDVLSDVAYAEGDNTGEGYVAGKAAYRTVAQADVSSILGHWVQLDGTTYTATRDHLLVDKEDFNAPIEYTFENTTDNKHRMWYQRTPDNYVDASTGWEAISIPFEAEIVTTQTKGELTHFYHRSETGHEYWLRGFAGNVRLKQGETDIYEADFNKPAAGENTKEYTNTFLWDYYYSKDSYLDKNEDEYQKQYYNTSHTYEGYPRQAAGTPYLVGFPGSRYYEFDLSGTWIPSNRYNNEKIASPGKQTITFASETGTTINVSDTELSSKTVNAGSSYSFTPNYMGESIDAGAFFLNGDGSSFKKTTAATTAVPFRPYFTATAPARELTRSIVFSDESSKMGGDDRGNKHGGILDIYAKRKKIVVASTLPHAVDVRIVTTGGITLSAFTVEPGETVETRVNSSGIYIVHTSDARYTTKLSVR